MTLNQLTALKIKELRKSIGYSAEAVAKDLGLSKTAYSQMENGHIEITLSRIEMIAKVYKIPVSEIIPSGSNNQQISNGSGNNFNSTHSVNNFFTETNDKLKTVLDMMNETLNIIKDKQNNH